MTRPILAPIPDADWPAEIGDMQDGFAGQLNVYRIMAHHPALLRAWATLRAHVVTCTALGPVRAEIVILRLAARLDCSYEWNQHVLRGLAVGLTQDQISTLRGPVADMAPKDALLASAVDDLLDHSRLTPERMDALWAVVGEKGVLDLMATTGMYLTLGFMLNTAPPPLEPATRAALSEKAPDLAR